MLRGVFLSAAAVDERAAEVFEDIFMAASLTAEPSRWRQEMLPLQLPEDAVATPEDAEEGAEGEDRPPWTRSNVGRKSPKFDSFANTCGRWFLDRRTPGINRSRTNSLIVKPHATTHRHCLRVQSQTSAVTTR